MTSAATRKSPQLILGAREANPSKNPSETPKTYRSPARPLFDVAATREIEHEAQNRLPAHTLMQRAGLSTAKLALALAPHADTYWIACGPGNNGGDGLEAAVHLRQWGKSPIVTWLGTLAKAPADAGRSLQRGD